MGKIVRFIAGLIGVLIILPILVLVGLYVTVDMESLKKEITQQASAKLGREIALNGPVGFSFEHGLAISLKDVRVGNPAGFKDKDFLKASKVSVALNWQALADHRVDIEEVVIEEAAVNLITNPSGQNNWDIKMAANDAAPAKADSAPEAKGESQPAPAHAVDSTFKIERVDLNSIEIIKSNVLQKDERNGKQQDLAIEKATIKAPVNAALNVDAKGDYNKLPFTVELNVPGGLKQISEEGKPTPLTLNASMGSQTYKIKGTYIRTAKSHELQSMTAKLMGMDVMGSLKASTDGDVPMVTGNLTIPELNLVTLGNAAPKTARKKTEPVIQSLVQIGSITANRIVAATPAQDFKALKAVNANLALNIGKLIFATGKQAENVKTNLVLSSGKLTMNPFSFTFLNVAYKGSLEFNSNGTPVTHLVLNGSNINFTELAAAFDSKSPLSANGDLNLDVTGSGTSPESFKNSLSGKIEMIAGKGAVDLGRSGAAGLSLIKMLYPKTTATEKENINCGVVRFNADRGVLRSNGILFDSPLAAVVGEGSVDLVHDNANLLFRQGIKDKQAGSLFNVPMKATGPLSNLSIMPEEKAVAQRVMSAINGGGSGSSGVPKVDPNAKGNGCVAVLNDPHPPMIEEDSAQDAAKSTFNAAKDAIKSGKDVINNIGKPGDAINKLKGLFGH